MTTRFLVSTITAALAAGTVLSACGTTPGPANPTDTSPSVSAPAMAEAHNQADVTFVQQMIPHHTQAVAMSKLAADDAGSAQVKDLAARIQTAQQPEIDQMNGFLQAWNIGMSTPAQPPMSGMNHGDMGGGSMDHGSMPGMMSSTQMRELELARGAAFDKMYLQMMIAHHQGAITMAETELRDGQSSDAKALARSIVDAQKREITEMQTLEGK